MLTQELDEKKRSIEDLENENVALLREVQRLRAVIRMLDCD